MTELKAYLVRAACDWAVEQNFTPHVAVDATYPGVAVPAQFVQDGRIVLNIHPRAVQNFNVGDDGVWFSARFGGRTFEISIPLPAILAVYARENSQGISFPEPAPPGEPPETPPEPPSGDDAGGERPARKGPQLRVVK